MDQMFHQVFSPTKILFGVDSAKNLPQEIQAIGGGNALMVADPGIVASGLVSPLINSIEAAGLRVSLFDEVKPEPSSSLLDKGAERAKEIQADIVIGIGGGSSLDVAKGVSFLVRNSGTTSDYYGIETIPSKGLPLILIPTTAGTGSEVSRGIIVVDEQSGIKKAIVSRHAMADTAIVDPLLNLSMPKASRWIPVWMHWFMPWKHMLPWKPPHIRMSWLPGRLR